MEYTYPIILKPTVSSFFSLPSFDRKKICKKSAIEILALSCASELNLVDIFDNGRVIIKGHQYEPDLVYCKPEKGVYIDIEIDEPYSVTGHATHYLENGKFKDAYRNFNFQEYGWNVIRFSERQIFEQTKSCLKEVYKLALQAGAIDVLPKQLEAIPDIISDACWTKEKSFQLRREHYREHYLGMKPDNFYIKDIPQYLKVGIPILKQALRNDTVRDEVIRSLKACFMTRRKP